MPKIAAICTHCRSRFAVSSAAIGKSAKCTNCQQSFIVRASQPKVDARKSNQLSGGKRKLAGRGGQTQTKKQRVDQLKESLKPCFQQEQIEPARVGVSYRLALLMVAALMILLPLAYLLLILATGYAVYYHAANHWELVTIPGGGFYGMVFKVFAYVGPVFAGVIVILFLIKPVLARPSHKMTRRFVTRQSEPVLFWFIDKICTAVRSPRPNRVYVDCDANAAASWRRGFFSMLHGSDLSLHIGMPLVASLNTQQLAGILAHEFGHFSQRGGMRLTYVIYSINDWFWRVANERDAWDEWLESTDEETHWSIDLLFMFASFCVFLSRLILKLFTYLGHMICCALLRQMEFDADRSEIKLCGTDNFIRTTRELATISSANARVMFDNLRNAGSGKINKNIPESINRRASKMSPREKREAAEKAETHSVGWFGTHPSDGNRIAWAQRIDAPGIFGCDEPARILFLEFDRLCEQVSTDFYQKYLGISVRRKRGREKKDWMVE